MKKGFTLLELLIVIAIIAILTVVMLPTITGAPAKARDAARVSTVESIVTAIEKIVLDGGTYPTETGCSAAPLAAPWIAISNAMKSVPKPPSAPKVDSLCITGTTGTGNFYYRPLTTNGNYLVAVALESKDKANLEDGATDGTNSGVTVITAQADGNKILTTLDGPVSNGIGSPAGFYYVVVK